MLCPQLLMTEHGHNWSWHGSWGRMVRPLSDLGCVAKQISVMVVGYCFLRGRAVGVEGFEISESQGVDYGCAPPPCA